MKQGKSKSSSKQEAVIEEQEQQTPKYYVQKLLSEDYQKHSIPLVQNMLDTDLQNFMVNVKSQDSIEKVTRKIIRLRDVDWLADYKQGAKRGRKEFLVFYQDWYGIDSNNNPIPEVNDLFFGLDAIISETEKFYDSQGKELPILKTNPNTKPVHTIEWNNDLVKDLVELSSRTGPDSIDFQVHSNGQKYGGYTYDEMITLSFDDLVKIGQYGRKGQYQK